MSKLNAAYMGYRNREAGAVFEDLIQTALGWYEAKGIAKVEKTPEPMRPLSKPNGRGRFLACFTKQAQADYTGTMSDGRRCDLKPNKPTPKRSHTAVLRKHSWKI